MTHFITVGAPSYERAVPIPLAKILVVAYSATNWAAQGWSAILCWMPKFTTILALLWSWNILPNPDLLKVYIYIYSGSILLPKVRLARCKMVLLLRDFLVKCFTLETIRPCVWHCLSRHDYFTSMIEFSFMYKESSSCRIHAEISWGCHTTLLMSSWLVFDSCFAFSFVFASSNIKPSCRWVQVKSSLSLLCNSIHVVKLFVLWAPLSSSSKLRTLNLVQVSL